MKKALSSWWNTHSHQLLLPTRKPVSSEQIAVPASRRARIAALAAAKWRRAALRMLMSAPSLISTP